MRNESEQENGGGENNYDKKNYKELKEINFWFIINTIFTILTGVATLILAVMQYLNK